MLFWGQRVGTFICITHTHIRFIIEECHFYFHVLWHISSDLSCCIYRIMHTHSSRHYVISFIRITHCETHTHTLSFHIHRCSHVNSLLCVRASNQIFLMPVNFLIDIALLLRGVSCNPPTRGKCTRPLNIGRKSFTTFSPLSISPCCQKHCEPMCTFYSIMFGHLYSSHIRLISELNEK